MSQELSIYHEKQSKQLCALHTLNNLFQSDRAFCKQDLDQLCEKLSPDFWFNPHKSVLGIGNYDVNVMIAALQQKSYEMTWWDKRKPASEINLSEIFGLVLNISSPSRIGGINLPFKSKHWIAVRCFNNIFYNLDSKLHSPEKIGSESQLVEYLKNMLSEDTCELFVVTPSNQSNTCTLAKEEDTLEFIG